MPLVSRPFAGADFFARVRAEMDADRGLFAGRDDSHDFRYVVLDATFYRMEIYLRPAGRSFTQGALALPPDIRCVMSGQHFSGGYSDYARGEAGITGPVSYQGQIVIAHTPRRVEPRLFNGHHHIGQWDGRSTSAFAVALGEPGNVTSPATYNHAMGRLIPLIEGGVPFAPPGTVARAAAPVRTSPETAGWFGVAAEEGKAVVGIHRATQSLFTLIQEDEHGSGGMSYARLIGLLHSMGVDDAVMGDGSKSATLVLDRVAEVDPPGRKDNNNSTGLMFRLQRLRTRLNVSMTIAAATADPRFGPGPEIPVTGAELSLEQPGARLRIAGLGHAPGTLAADAGATLAAGSANPGLPVGTPLTGIQGEVVLRDLECALTITGFGYTLAALAANGTLIAGDNLTTTIPQGTRFQGAGGQLHRTGSGSRITLTTIGSRAGMSPAQAAAQLGITLPLVLESSSSSLATLVGFSQPSGPISGSLRLIAGGGGGGGWRLSGSLDIDTGSGVVPFTVDWPLVREPLTPAEVASRIGLTVPIRLYGPGSDLAAETRLSRAGAEARLRLDTPANAPGSLVGTLMLTAPNGNLTMNTNLTLHSRPYRDRDLPAALGVTLPFDLRSPASNLVASQLFTSTPLGRAEADLRLQPQPTSDGRMTGELRFTSGPALVCQLDWPLETAP